jgi:hypothetical protein
VGHGQFHSGNFRHALRKVYLGAGGRNISALTVSVRSMDACSDDEAGKGGSGHFMECLKYAENHKAPQRFWRKVTQGNRNKDNCGSGV